MSDPAEDAELRQYLHRKSALSLGYKKVYVDAPPAELDRAIKARARRALTWLGPAALAAAITSTLVIGIVFGVHKWIGVMEAAERNVKRLEQQREEQRLEEERRKPISVAIDAKSLAVTAAAQSRQQWQAEISALRQAGKQAEADVEQQRFDAMYSQSKK